MEGDKERIVRLAKAAQNIAVVVKINTNGCNEAITVLTHAIAMFIAEAEEEEPKRAELRDKLLEGLKEVISDGVEVLKCDAAKYKEQIGES